ncbi:hypothetical protein IGX29_17660 [Streptomyces sp. H28]|uniref:hypothetical protein n=1 Tax=Streptomyces sp. H28 TaxID=2775865 RepID=UPI0017871060|nr:hypothetical protein [Streptomyces sp. H28]MBD9733595.1 hypothetical protein [Streptomyces sp. H28]
MSTALTARAAADVGFAEALRAWVELAHDSLTDAETADALSGGLSRTTPRNRLIALVRRASIAAGTLGRSDARERLLRHCSALMNEHFRVVVVGRGRADRAALINSLLGADVLSAADDRASRVPTQISYGTVPSARLLPAGPAGTRAPTAEVAVRDVAARLAPGRDGVHPDARYGQVEIRWPAELCRDGLVLVDAPGLAAEGSYEESITVGGADLLLAVLENGAPTLEEARFLDDRRTAPGAVPLFLVVDEEESAPTGQRAELRTLVREQVTPLLRSDDALFFVQPREALRARRGKDGPTGPEPGLHALERSLLHRASAQRAPVLLRSAQALGTDIAGLVAFGHGALEALRSEQAALAEVRLHAVRRGRDLLTQTREQLVVEGVRCLHLAAEACPHWAEQAQLRSGGTFRVRASLRARADELTGLLLQQTQEQVDRWYATVPGKLLDVAVQLAHLFDVTPPFDPLDEFALTHTLTSSLPPPELGASRLVRDGMPSFRMAKLLDAALSGVRWEAVLRAATAEEVAGALRRGARDDAEELAARAVEPLQAFLRAVESHSAEEGSSALSPSLRERTDGLLSCLASLQDIETEYRRLVADVRAAGDVAPGRRPPMIPRVTVQPTAPRVGLPVEVRVRLDRGRSAGAAGDSALPPMLLVSSVASSAQLRPVAREYTVDGVPAAFSFVAHASGSHRLRFTVYDRVLGLVLQDFEAIVDVPAPGAAPSSALLGRGSV